LSGCYFEKVLDTVNDVDASSLVNFTDIASAEPVAIECLCSFLLILEIAFKHNVSSNEQLSPRIRKIVGRIVHIRNILQTELRGRNYRTTMSRREVSRQRK
jgi:hypothetical protein